MMIYQNFNYHTHTFRCGHAKGKDEEYIQTAIKAGYKILGFSEHIQYRAMNGKLNRINYEAFDEYFDSIHFLKRKYGNEIKILCGLETEFIPEWLADLYDIRKKCDYFILGQHIGAPDTLQYYECCTDTEVLQYAVDIEYAVRTGLFSIIAHPDYFMLSRDNWSYNCEEAARKICKISKTYKIPLEINLKGLKTQPKKINKNYVHPYPFRPFLEIASEYSVPVIFGVDAHSPEELYAEDLYHEAVEILEGISLNFKKLFYPYNYNRRT